jgi:hypothetical protein
MSATAQLTSHIHHSPRLLLISFSREVGGLLLLVGRNVEASLGGGKGDT